MFKPPLYSIILKLVVRYFPSENEHFNATLLYRYLFNFSAGNFINFVCCLKEETYVKENT